MASRVRWRRCADPRVGRDHPPARRRADQYGRQDEGGLAWPAYFVTRSFTSGRRRAGRGTDLRSSMSGAQGVPACTARRPRAGQREAVGGLADEADLPTPASPTMPTTWPCPAARRPRAEGRRLATLPTKRVVVSGWAPLQAEDPQADGRRPHALERRRARNGTGSGRRWRRRVDGGQRVEERRSPLAIHSHRRLESSPPTMVGAVNGEDTT
jgi:hypothetical protein